MTRCGPSPRKRWRVFPTGETAHGVARLLWRPRQHRTIRAADRGRDAEGAPCGSAHIALLIPNVELLDVGERGTMSSTKPSIRPEGVVIRLEAPPACGQRCVGARPLISTWRSRSGTQCIDDGAHVA